MRDASPSRRVVARVLAAVVLLAVLGGLFVVAGTDAPNPAVHDYPDEEDIGPNPSQYVGQQVTVGGRVVATDPVVVEATYGTGETYQVTVTGVEESTSEGDYITVYGTLEDESSVAADRAILREPWEVWYMYVVSFLGGAWVLTRTVRRWRVDSSRMAVVPREEPLSFRGGGDA